MPETRKIMSARANKPQRECLLLCPFEEPYNAICSQVFFPAISQAGFKPLRADQLQSSKPILELVTERIENCSVIVADISDSNPNVSYEIGIAHTLGRPVVMTFCGLADDIPFYFRPYKVIAYAMSGRFWKRQLLRDVVGALQNFESFSPRSDIPALGLSSYFDGDNDAFFRSIEREVDRCSVSMVFVGWGLAFLLAQRHELLKKIARRVDNCPKLRISVLLPQPRHPGLVVRIKEEMKAQHVGIVPDWPDTFFRFAKELETMVKPKNRRRVTVARISYLPTAMVLKMDDVFYFRPYGPPNTGGRHCPWLRILSDSAVESWVAYLQNMVDFALRDCRESANK
jgi:hypothetical protein